MVLKDAIIDLKDGGWLACGPVVIAAHTGSSLTWIETLFRWHAGCDGVSTRASDLDRVLRHFNLSLSLGYIADWGREESLLVRLEVLP
jgi:hypothetical protein